MQTMRRDKKSQTHQTICSYEREHIVAMLKHNMFQAITWSTLQNVINYYSNSLYGLKQREIEQKRLELNEFRNRF